MTAALGLLALLSVAMVARIAYKMGHHEGLRDADHQRRMAEFVPTGTHVHSAECWEPDSGCDMGRNEAHVARDDAVYGRHG